MRISARTRLNMFLDEGDHEEIGKNVKPVDPLKFKDSKKYKDRITQAQKQTKENDALVVMKGQLKGRILLLPPLISALWADQWVR